MKTKKINREDIRDQFIGMMLSKKEKASIEEAAKKKSTTVSTFIRMIVIEHLNKEQ